MKFISGLRLEPKAGAVIAVFWALLLSVPFLGMSLPEDTGFYGFVSRAVTMGYLPHRDIPEGQNSIGFYINAAVMSVFGASPLVLRLIYVVYAALLAWAYYRLCLKLLGGPRRALAASLITLLLVMQPQLQFGLARNNLLPALLFISLGIDALLFGEGRVALFLAGLFAGLAADFNESLLFLLLGFAAVALRGGEGRVKRILALAGGAAAAFLIPAAILTYGNCWKEYIINMLYYGLHFRPNGPQTSRMQSWWFVSWDFIFLYSFLIIAYRPLAFKQLRGAAENALNIFIVPVLIAVAFIVNTVKEYHLMFFIPFMVPGALTTALFCLGRLKGQNAAFCGRTFCVSALSASGLLFVFLNLPVMAADYWRAFKESRALWPYYAAGKEMDVDERSIRAVRILDRLPYRVAGSNSQYPILFLAKKMSVSRPIVEDFTACVNSDGLLNMRDMINYMQAEPPGVFVGLRNYDRPTKGILGLFLKTRYICIADFRTHGSRYYLARYAAKKITESTHARTDLYYSLKALDEYFRKVYSAPLAGGMFIKKNPRLYEADISALAQRAAGGEPCIIEVRFPAQKPDRAYLLSGYYGTYFDKYALWPDRLHIFAFPGKAVRFGVYYGSSGFRAEISVYRLKTGTAAL